MNQEENQLNRREQNEDNDDRMDGENPQKKVEEKLDEDFLFFLTYIPVTYKNLKDDKDKMHCKDWLKQLTSRRPETVAGKRNRNIYLVNLILNMGDGKLQQPFTNSPPYGKLLPAKTYFGTIEPPLPCPESMNFQIEDFSQISKDGRTFFAARALPDGRGAFAYVGVSMGGGDTVWLNSSGEPICPEELSKSRENQSKLDESCVPLMNLLKNRVPCLERNELVPFYEDHLNRVKEIICTYGTEGEICDPAIEKLIEDLQIETVEEGKFDSETINCYTKLHWLQALQQKIECQLQIATARQLELNKLEETLTQKDGITFLDISKSIKSPRIDTMFAEAARDRPTPYNVDLLRKNYSDCLVQKLLKLLEKEKLNVIHQERNAYQDFILQLKVEIMNEVKRGLDKYAAARKEWHRVATVMRRVEEEKNKILQEIERITVDADPDFTDKDNVLNEELLRAKKNLEDAKDRNDKVEARINSLHDQVHHLALEFEKMQNEARRGNDQLAQEVSYLQREVRQQEHKLSFLKKKVKEQKRKEACPRP